MNGNIDHIVDLPDELDGRLTASAISQRSNVLSNKVTSILSASYADNEIRDALQTLDGREVENTAEFRRNLRLDVQKEVIERNGAIVRDFGHVAEVRYKALC